MRTATKAIRFIETVQEQGIKREAAKEIVELVEERQEDLATTKDIERVEKEVKTNRWIFGIAVGAILALMVYLHSDTKADMNRRFEKVEGRLEKVEGRLEKMEGRLEKMEADLREIKQLIRER